MPLIVDKYILLIAEKRKKSTKTKHTNKQTKKNMYTDAYQRRVNGGKSPERREQTI